MRNSYTDCLELAGAKVLAAEEFGSYQGDWWAKVEYKGETFWVHGCYGSCSGCDAFEAEFGYQYGACEEHRYSAGHFDACADCQKEKQRLQERKAAFGKRYLTDDIHDQASAEKLAKKDTDWDLDAQDMLIWLRDNKI